MRRAVITGLGCVTPIGQGVEEFWAALTAGESGVRRITQFDPSDLDCQIAAEVKDWDPTKWMEAKSARRAARFSQFAVAAARQAVEDAELATYAYAGAGAEGLYDYLSEGVTDACTKEQVKEALAAHEQPTGWQQIKDVTFQSEDAATATVILIYRSERQEEEWTFVREGTSWRIDNVPGLESCESAG